MHLLFGDKDLLGFRKLIFHDTSILRYLIYTNQYQFSHFEIHIRDAKYRLLRNFLDNLIDLAIEYLCKL